MHYKTPKLDFPIEKVDPFLEGNTPLLRLTTSEVEINQDSIDNLAGTVVLNSAL
jgi:hypothetical protein